MSKFHLTRTDALAIRAAVRRDPGRAAYRYLPSFPERDVLWAYAAFPRAAELGMVRFEVHQVGKRRWTLYFPR